MRPPFPERRVIPLLYPSDLRHVFARGILLVLNVDRHELNLVAKLAHAQGQV